jgi:hypothetical protein
MGDGGRGRIFTYDNRCPSSVGVQRKLLHGEENRKQNVKNKDLTPGCCCLGESLGEGSDFYITTILKESMEIKV